MARGVPVTWQLDFRTAQAEQQARWRQQGIDGLWGYCDQQMGPDGITHWGCPWGLFYVSPVSSLAPPSDHGALVGVPWTLRDLHNFQSGSASLTFSIPAATLCPVVSGAFQET